MVHGVVAHGRVRPALPYGQLGYAVLAHVVGQLFADQLGRRRHKVAQAQRLGALAASRYAVGPRRDEGYAVPALVYVGLVPAEYVAGVVTRRQQRRIVGHGRAAVVACEYYERVVVYALFAQLCAYLTHHVVHHQHEVAVAVRARFALKFGRGQYGRVRRGQREVYEEGPVRPLVYPFQRALGQLGQYLLVVKVGRGGAFAPEALTFGRGLVIGQRRGGAAVYVYVGRHVQRRGYAEVAVEAVIQRAAVYGAGIVHAVHRGKVGRLTGAGRFRPVQTQVPLAHAAGNVACAAHKVRHGAAVGLYKRLGVAAYYAALQPRAPVVAPGQYAVARRRAHRRGGVHIGAAHTAARHCVYVYRVQLGIRVKAGYVAVAHVVGQYVYDVGQLSHFECRPFGPSAALGHHILSILS